MFQIPVAFKAYWQVGKLLLLVAVAGLAGYFYLQAEHYEEQSKKWRGKYELSNRALVATDTMLKAEREARVRVVENDRKLETKFRTYEREAYAAQKAKAGTGMSDDDVQRILCKAKLADPKLCPKN